MKIFFEFIFYIGKNFLRIYCDRMEKKNRYKYKVSIEERLIKIYVEVRRRIRKSFLEKKIMLGFRG